MKYAVTSTIAWLQKALQGRADALEHAGMPVPLHAMTPLMNSELQYVTGSEAGEPLPKGGWSMSLAQTVA